MRVIAGSAKGTMLLAPEGTDITRPTADRVKEAVFGALQFELAGSRVLDLFAGSGALGIEALSRGAAEAVFADHDKKALALIRANLEKTRLYGKATVIEADYAAALARVSGGFDFIFLDPPYKGGLYGNAVRLIDEKNLLCGGGRIIAEHDGSIDFGEREKKRKKYGKTYVSFLAGE